MRTHHSEHIETVIVGAGQAGLATGYHLQRAGRPFVILDGEARVGDGWRQQWDSLRLFSPAQADGLPGMPFPGPRWSFPTKDEFADYLESYAAQLPATGSSAHARRPGSAPRRGVRRDGRRARDPAPTTWSSAPAPSGVRPHVPGFADQLDPSIRQLHSSEYRRPAQLPDGPVLVVGASHSGCDIAYELAATHPTVLCGPDTGQIPVTFDSPLFKVVFPTMLFMFRNVLRRTEPHRAQGPGALPATVVRGFASNSATSPSEASTGSSDTWSAPATAAGVGRRPRGRRPDRRVVHRVPPGVRLGRGAGLRSRRMAGRDAWGGRWRARPVLLRHPVPVRRLVDARAGRRPGRRLRRRPDRGAPGRARPDAAEHVPAA